MSQPPKTLQLTSRKTLAFSLSFLTLMATLTITAEEGRMRLKAVQPWVFDDLHAWSFAPTPGCMTNGIPSAALGAGLFARGFNQETRKRANIWQDLTSCLPAVCGWVSEVVVHLST
jgi:hypothetical protein